MNINSDIISEIEDAEGVEAVYADAFCFAIKEFFNSRFLGCIEIISKINNKEAILPSYLMPTLLLKELLSYCKEDVYFSVFIYDNGERIEFDIKPYGVKSVDNLCTHNLIKLARSGGMNIMPRDDFINIAISTSYSDRRSIYAPSPISDVNRIINLLNGIFFKNTTVND